MKIDVLDKDLDQYDIDFLERSLPAQEDQQYFNSLMNTLGRKQGVLNAVMRSKDGYAIYYTPYNSIVINIDDTINEILNSTSLKDYALIGYLKIVYGLIINKVHSITIDKDNYQVIYI